MNQKLRQLSEFSINESIKRAYETDKKTVADIALEFNLSTWKVRKILRELDVRVQKGRSSTNSKLWKDIDDTELKRLYVKERLTLAEIGKRFGCDDRTVKAHLITLGVVTDESRRRFEERHPNWKKLDWDELATLYCTDELSIIKISQLKHCAPCTVRSRLRKMHVQLRGKARGNLHPHWKGGRKKDGAGYIRVYAPDHPRAYGKAYVFEHILVWENTHKQYVPEGYLIHHLNGIKDDNRPENLLALPRNGHSPTMLLKEVQRKLVKLEKEITELRRLDERTYKADDGES